MTLFMREPPCGGFPWGTRQNWTLTGLYVVSEAIHTKMNRSSIFEKLPKLFKIMGVFVLASFALSFSEDETISDALAIGKVLTMYRFFLSLFLSLQWL